jgi:AbrB family looped-hinge helix DNA binding protein
VATTLTSKGQVTIPKPIREYLGLDAGDAVEFEFADDGSVLVRGAHKPAPKVRRGKFARLVGANRRGAPTDRLMAMLRGYDEDSADPGLK